MSELDPILAEIAELHAAKAKGYGRPGEAFHNIIEGAKFAGIAPWVAALLRAGDKMGRLSLAAQGNPASDESVEDNLLDLINYGCIALALWRRDHGPSIDLEPVRTLLAPDYPERSHVHVMDRDASGVESPCRVCGLTSHQLTYGVDAKADPLKTEPEDWHVLEHGGPDA